MRPYTPGNGTRVRSDRTGRPPTSGESARFSACCADAGSISKAVTPPNSNPARFLIAFMGDLPRGRRALSWRQDPLLAFARITVLESISYFEAPAALTAGPGDVAIRSEERGRAGWRGFQRMSHEFKPAAHGSAVRGAAKANARRFGRDSLRRESVARHHPDTGRAHVPDQSGTRPTLPRGHPQVKADRLGANAAWRQDLARDRICEPLPLRRVPAHRSEPRFAPSV